jgi:ABC-type molybdate transport system substrate-binding protein
VRNLPRWQLQSGPSFFNPLALHFLILLCPSPKQTFADLWRLRGNNHEKTTVRGTARRLPGAQAAQVVASGGAELGIGQTSEIVPVASAQVVGPLPGNLASVTLFAAGIGVGAGSPEAGKTLIHFLTSPDAATIFRSKGFEPR